MRRPFETAPLSRRAHTGANIGNLSLLAAQHRQTAGVWQAEIRQSGPEQTLPHQQPDAVAIATIAVLQRLTPRLGVNN